MEDTNVYNFYPLKLLIVATMLLIATILSSSAAEIELLQPFGSFALRDPPDPPPPGGPYIYSDTGSRSDWFVSQWNIPGGKLSSFARSETSTGVVFRSHAATADIEITQTIAGLSVKIAQNGRVLPCLNNAGTPREFDLFLSPGKLRGRSNPRTSGPQQAHKTSLANLVALKVTARVRVHMGTGGRRQDRCNLNKGNAMIALIMHDRSTRPGQVFFYQLALNSYCKGKCSSIPKHFNFFANQNPFGVDDDLPLAGQLFLTDNDTRALEVQLLPRLKKVIAASPVPMDRDLNHWFIDGMYLGQHIYGDVAIASEWQDVQLIAVTEH
jgi:hypothetical protein